MEKDYSMLRQFDLEAAKRGEPFVFIENGELNPREYIAGPDCRGLICIKYPNGKFDICIPDQYRMAPLCWVEGKPVYKGDVLFNQTGATVRRVLSRALGGDEVLCDDGLSDPISALTWTPPKGKREGWVNVYKDSNQAYRHDTKEKADAAAKMAIGTINPNRVACIRIEWEE